MYYSSSTKTFSSSYFNSSYACSYNLDTSSSLISGYNITATLLINANLTIYVEETTGSYTFRNTLSSSGSTSVSIGSYDDVFIVATTSSSSAYVSFNVIVANIDIDNSSDSSTGLSGGVIASIVIGLIVFIGLIVGLCILHQYRTRKKLREQTEAVNNTIADTNRAQNNNRQTNVSFQRQPQPEPTMGQMIPQPPQYDPVYMSRYQSQPPQAAFYGQSVPAYPQMNLNTKFQPQVKVYPTPMVPESAVQSQIIVHPNSQVPPTTQTRNQVTWYNT